jgi:hypothetical protein
MLDRHGRPVPITVKIEQGVLVEVPGLGNLDGAKFDIQGICVLKIFDLYGLNLRLQKALCTVSPSGNSLTRTYLASISSIEAKRQIQPSC